MAQKAYTPEQLRQRSVAAKRILNDKLFKEIVGELEEYLTRKWRRTDPGEHDAREDLWRCMKGLDLVLQRLRTVEAKGTVSGDAAPETRGG